MVALAVLAFSFALSAQAGPSKGNAVAGKAIFASKCVACHKADGTGGIKLTGNVTPNWKDPKVWKDPARVKGGDDFLRDCIVNGKVKSGMVAWGKTGQLKPAQVEDVIAYINTLAKKK
jgi:cytochrome c oxidase cbb3-type subunit 3